MMKSTMLSNAMASRHVTSRHIEAWQCLTPLKQPIQSSGEELNQALIALGLQQRHLSSALNTCPPGYLCSLIRALRADLERHYGASTSAYSSWPSDHGIGPPPTYTLDEPRARIVMRQLDDILQLLHDPDVRSVLRRVYVNKQDPTLRLCICPDSCRHLKGNAMPLLARTVGHFHAWMEREHALVVSSDSMLSNPTGLKKTRTQTKQAGTFRVDETLESMSLSTGFGSRSVTAAPCARLLAFLSSEHIPPSLRLCSRSHFLDIGCGIGQVVLHTQFQKACASCIGVECKWDRWNAAHGTLERLKQHRRHQQHHHHHQQQQQQRREHKEQDDVEMEEPQAVRTTAQNQPAAPSMFSELAPVLDDRLDRVQFIHDPIERHPQLVTEATHVFMFDHVFSQATHDVLLPLLFNERPRIIITCLSSQQIQQMWVTLGQKTLRPDFSKLGEETLTMAGAKGSTRKVFIYATQTISNPY